MNNPKLFDFFLCDDEYNYLIELFSTFGDYHQANNILEDLTGIVNFFKDKNEIEIFKGYIDNPLLLKKFNAGRDWGDVQTPKHLTDNICTFLKKNGCSPLYIIEPTFGLGSFIFSCLEIFTNAECIYGVEIQKHYHDSLKFLMLKRIANKITNNIRIILKQDNIFSHIFPEEITKKGRDNILIIGNPPWVTNSELSGLKSNNLPLKSNFKQFKGIDAVTGKANFDIGEYIILKLLSDFSQTNGHISMICKNIVIRNIVKEIPKTHFPISSIKSLSLNAKKEFNASCDASVFLATLCDDKQEQWADIIPLDSSSHIERQFGWVQGRFVSDIKKYISLYEYDGKCPFKWRSGIKHDLAKIMEIQVKNGQLWNLNKEQIDIELDLVYPLIKSSDIKKFEIKDTQRLVIVTQKCVGEDTDFIKDQLPKTWDYLASHLQLFNKRKSKIYENKPHFSIFGVGDYSFFPYKIVISGLYKKPFFSLVPPINYKPVILDDTCYFIGFQNYKPALILTAILNSALVRDLLSSMVFSDSKRVYTKETLMRIDIAKITEKISLSDIVDIILENDPFFPIDLSDEDYNDFKKTLILHD